MLDIHVVENQDKNKHKEDRNMCTEVNKNSVVEKEPKTR